MRLLCQHCGVLRAALTAHRSARSFVGLPTCHGLPQQPRHLSGQGVSTRGRTHVAVAQLHAQRPLQRRGVTVHAAVRAAAAGVVDVDATVEDGRIPVTVITGFLGCVALASHSKGLWPAGSRWGARKGSMRPKQPPLSWRSCNSSIWGPLRVTRTLSGPGASDAMRVFDCRVSRSAEQLG
jgi:hypothetical protein